MKFFEYDVVKERQDRKIKNIETAFKFLKDLKSEPTKKQSDRKINFEEYLRKRDLYCNRFGWNEKTFLQNFNKDDERLFLFADVVSINATRQNKEEGLILNGLNEWLNNNLLGAIETLPSSGEGALRPIRTGGLKQDTKVNFPNKTIKKQIGLKTIDGMLYTKQTTGYISQKAVCSQGGHQDNVSREAQEFINWAANEPKENLYIVLMDGDESRKNELKDIYESDNIWVVNHVEFQQRMVEYVKSKETSGAVLYNQESI